MVTRILLTIYLTATVLILGAQTMPDVVVNEYNNQSTQNQEYTEIIVGKDNLDMRGWFFGDNNGTTDNWQPKLKFIATGPGAELWNGLRRGTYIIIDHADTWQNCATGASEDVNKADGYIRICSKNPAYFVGGTATTLNLNSAGDFIHLVKPGPGTGRGTHIHGIGHDPNPGRSVEGGSCVNDATGWISNTGPLDNTRPCGPFTFVKSDVGNGRSLGYVTDQPIEYTRNPGVVYNDTTNPILQTGPATRGHGNSLANSALITSLRTPQWVSESVCIVPQPTGNRIVWPNTTTDPNPPDLTTGYMVLRGRGRLPLPEQGRQYRVGEIIQGPNGPGDTARVLDYVTPSYQGMYVDQSPTLGASYIIIAYKYTTDARYPRAADRGRTYNLNQYLKAQPATLPQLDIVFTPACAGDTTTLRLTPPTGVDVAWTLPPGYQAIGPNNKDSIRVRVQGRIRDSAVVMAAPLGLSSCIPGIFTTKVYLDTAEAPILTGTSPLDSGSRNALLVDTKGANFKGSTASLNLNLLNVLSTGGMPDSVFFTAVDSSTIRVFTMRPGTAGCRAHASFRFTLKPKVVELPKLYMPNLLTANGDDINETLDFGAYRILALRLYNRWGRLVYSAAPYFNDYKPAPGYYFYEVELLPATSEPIFKVNKERGWLQVTN